MPTFSAVGQRLEPEAVSGIDCVKVFTEIQMQRTVSEGMLRDSAKEHMDKIGQTLVEGNVMSVLHVHLSMKQDNAADVLDYLRFQIERCVRELQKRVDASNQHLGSARSLLTAVHVFALVVHGVRGTPDLCMRPFLFAGPVESKAYTKECSSVHAWTGVCVDHFSHLLPWGMRSEMLAYGSISDIFGLEEDNTDRFRCILADALPHIVPGLCQGTATADSFAVIQSLGSPLTVVAFTDLVDFTSPHRLWKAWLVIRLPCKAQELHARDEQQAGPRSIHPHSAGSGAVSGAG